MRYAPHLRPRWRHAPFLVACLLLLLLGEAGQASTYTIVPGGAPVTVTTTAVDEKAIASFAGTADKRISLRMTNVTIGTSPNASTQVSILKPDGTALVFPTYVGKNGGFIDTRTLPVTGTYQIVVDPLSTSTGSMTLTLYDVPADMTTTIVPGGAAAVVTTTVPGQNAAATFSGTVNKRVSLRMTGVTIGTSTTASAKVSILNPNGTTLVSPTFVGTNGGFLDAKTLPATGTYKVFVDPQNESTGSMTLTLYDVPADMATAIVPGGAAVTVTTTVPGQNAAATFSGLLNQRVSLQMTGVTIGTSTVASTKVSILKPDGTALVSPTNVGTNGGFLDTKTLPADGTYTIFVDPQSFSTGSMTLRLYDVPLDVGSSIVPGGAAVVVTMATPGQNASLTFDGTAERGVALKIDAVTIGPSTCCSTKVSILKPDGTTLVSPMSFGTTGLFIDTKTLPVSGAYTIFVDPQSSSTGSARLTLFDVPPEVAATITPGGAAVTVTTTAPYQNARVTFSGTAGERVSLKATFAPTSCCTANVSILKPDGTFLANPVGIGAGTGFIDAKTLPVTGTYAIFVDPQSAAIGSMTLTLYSLPADVTGTMTLNGPAVTVTTTVPGQNARLTFSGTAGNGVTLKIGPTCCVLTVSILKPDGTTLVSSGIGITGGTINTRLPTTGTYTIVVDYQSTAMGSVTLQLLLDVTPPSTPVLTITEGSANSHVAGTTFFYRPAGTGSTFSVAAATSDAGSGVQKVTFAGLSGAFSPTTLQTDFFSPYSQIYSWVTGATFAGAANAVTAYDKVGNTSSATFAVTIDSTAPATTDNTASIGSAWKNTNQTVTLTRSDGTGSGAATTYYTTNGSTPTTASSQGTSISLTADGVYTIKYFSVDNVSNTEAVKTASTQIRIDKTPPTSATLNPLPANIRNGQVLSGSGVDGGPSGLASISYYYCAGPPCTPAMLIGTSSTAPSYSFVWNAQPADGSYQVLTRVSDNAGNTLDSAKQTVTIDNSAPDTVLTAVPTNPSTSSVSFSFSSPEAGTTFQCQLDGGAFAACTSPKPYSGLAGGSHTFVVRAVDGAGNVDPTPASYTWTVDAVAPDTLITASPPALSASTDATFSFSSSQPGSTFQCKLDGGAFGACASSESYTGLAQGPHTFQVRATDIAGNVDPTPATFTWTVDTIAPAATITTKPSDPSNDTAPSFGFSSSEAGSTFECQLDGGAFAACTSPKPYSGLAAGSHTFAVRATDPAGNTGTPAGYTWTIDIASPDATITASPSDPSNDPNPSFSFTSSEGGSTFECSIDGASFAACSTGESYSALADGNHTFAVRATDPAGNTGASASYSWAIDTTAPETTITSAPSDPSPSPEASFSFSSSEVGSSFECSLDGAAFAVCTDPQDYTALGPGLHSFEVRATDQAGNVDASAAAHFWTVS